MAWAATAHCVPLIQDEAHVWLADLGNGAEGLEHFTPVLSEAERSILGRYLCVEPRAVRFQSGPRGKPELAMLEEEQLMGSASTPSPGPGEWVWT